MTTTTENMNNVYKPMFYRFIADADNTVFKSLYNSKSIVKYDTIQSQLFELMLCRNPSLPKRDVEKMDLVGIHLNKSKKTILEYGSWVYYPWRSQLVHILDEEEFIEVRTNRNKYKITHEEQEILRTKIVGIAGLSVGRAVATTMALERICGEIRLADFDELELSNLNRINAPLYELGINKTISVAREIVEVDPYIKVSCFENGLSEANMDDFFTLNGKMDLFIEECDDIKVKILSRLKCKDLRIPVVMETNDNGLIDIERYDLEELDVFHGLLRDLPAIHQINLSSTEDKIPFITKFSGLDDLSPRMKASLVEIERTIRSWPQLASETFAGGGVLAKQIRLILLNEQFVSGRFRFNSDLTVLEKKENIKQQLADQLPMFIEDIKDSIEEHNLLKENFGINLDVIKDIVNDSSRSTSAGNLQPWLWIENKRSLFLVKDERVKSSFVDRYEIGFDVSYGAVLKAMTVASIYRGYEAKIEYNPIKESNSIIAKVEFIKSEKRITKEEYELLFIRKSIRDRSEPETLDTKILFNLLAQFESPEVSFQVIENQDDILDLSKLLSEVEVLRMLDKKGHVDFFNEMKFPNSGEEVRQGIDISTLELSGLEKIGMKLMGDDKMREILERENLGSKLGELPFDVINSSNNIILMEINSNAKNKYLHSGWVVQSLWMRSIQSELSILPFTSLIYLFEYLNRSDKSISKKSFDKITNFHSRFYNIFDNDPKKSPVFLFRVKKSNEDKSFGKTLRKQVDDILISIGI